MPDIEIPRAPETFHFKHVFGVYVLTPDDVQFRTGSMSGPVCLVSDPEQRGLLGPIIARLVSPEARKLRPWNDAESEILLEIIPELQSQGIIEDPDQENSDKGPAAASRMFLRPPLTEARIALVGHGVLGEAVRLLLTGMPCGPISVIESTSVARPGPASEPVGTLIWSSQLPGDSTGAHRVLPKPRGLEQWMETLRGHDWVIAAQDCFEPEELAALNEAALSLSLPWSLVCFDGYEGWVGPTFVPGQTACFSCFRRRLFAAAAEPAHVFRDPSVKVHRVPSPWSAGLETGSWTSLIASMFALEVIAATEGRSFTLDNILVVHRPNMTFQRESVLRLPRCPDCSPRGGGPAINAFAHLLGTRWETP
jgi:bacteriocin biosynthesis cyclodehydratase domain-containing protein